jgi:hypothetical protein
VGSLGRQDAHSRLSPIRYSNVRTRGFRRCGGRDGSAGVVSFVPANSAPIEIAADERSMFRRENDAVERVDQALRGADALTSIRSRLSDQATLLSAKRCVASLRHPLAEPLATAVAAPTWVDRED